MKKFLQTALYLLVATSVGADEVTIAVRRTQARESAASSTDVVDSQPKLLRISATIDGSGRIIFTRQAARYEHKNWALPTAMMFDGEPWTNLSQTPPAWRDVVDNLDLTKAWIVKRKGRDVIALEHTPDGFDLYLSDSPNNAADYEVTIAIPRRK